MPERKPVPSITLENLLPPYPKYDYFADSDQNPFRHAAKSFEMVNAWWLAEASTLVYAEPDFVRDVFTSKAKMTEVKYFDRKGTQCFVAANDDFAVVAFRGTETSLRRSAPNFRDVFIDLVTDVDIILVDSGQGGRVHGGFKRGVDAVWFDADGDEGLSSYLKRLNADGRARKVWFTGHSLGAALAVLAAARFDDVQGLYTYGCPRACDEAFAGVFRQNFSEKFKTEHYRFVNDKDIVTTVPPQVFYRHVGSLKYIDGGGAIGDSPSLWERIRNKVGGVLKNAFDQTGRVSPGVTRLIPEGLADHVPTLYATHIWNAHVDEVKRA